MCLKIIHTHLLHHAGPYCSMAIIVPSNTLYFNKYFLGTVNFKVCPQNVCPCMHIALLSFSPKQVWNLHFTVYSWPMIHNYFSACWGTTRTVEHRATPTKIIMQMYMMHVQGLFEGRVCFFQHEPDNQYRNNWRMGKIQENMVCPVLKILWVFGG